MPYLDFHAWWIAGSIGLFKGDEVSTGSGPGSPRGQPAWGGGCDRVQA
jgi:hypothetical protein